MPVFMVDRDLPGVTNEQLAAAQQAVGADLIDSFAERLRAMLDEAAADPAHRP
jgi:hypothetical protein